jgi:hypothetical protein
MAIIARRQAGQQQGITTEATEVRRDVSQAGQSGRNLQALGKGIGFVEEKFRELKDLNDYTTSSIEKDQRMNQLYSSIDSAMLNGEISPFEAEAKLKDESNKIFKETSSRVSNPKYRAKFDLRASATVQSNVAKIQNVIRQKQIVEVKEKFATKSSELMQAILNSTSPSEKQDLLAEYDQMVNDSTGLLYNANDTSTLKSNFRENIRVGRIEHDMLNSNDSASLGAIRQSLVDNTDYNELTKEEKDAQVKKLDTRLELIRKNEKIEFEKAQEATTNDFLKKFIEPKDEGQRKEFKFELSKAVAAKLIPQTLAENLMLADEMKMNVTSPKNPQDVSLAIDSTVKTLQMLSAKGEGTINDRLAILNEFVKNHVDYASKKGDVLDEKTAGVSSDALALVLNAATSLTAGEAEELVTGLNMIRLQSKDIDKNLKGTIQYSVQKDAFDFFAKLKRENKDQGVDINQIAQKALEKAQRKNNPMRVKYDMPGVVYHEEGESPFMVNFYYYDGTPDITPLSIEESRHLPQVVNVKNKNEKGFGRA